MPGEIYISTIMVGDVNTPLPVTEDLSGRKSARV